MDSDAEEVRFRPHSKKQDDIIFSDEDLTIAATGTQFGKSISGGLWMKRQIHRFTASTDNFLLMAPTYKIMKQSALPYFLSCMDGYGEYRSGDAEFKLHDGGTVYMRTGTDPDSVVGIPNLKAYWLDEAGKAGLYFWENIQARAASQGALGLLTTSPYTRNWLYKDYIKKYLNGKLVPNTTIIRAASWENPYHQLHDEAKRRAQQAKMDPKRFDMIFGGEWGAMIGLVYDCFDEDECSVDPFILPAGTRFFAGVDWGFTEPLCISVGAVTPAGDHYQVSELYVTQHTLPRIIEAAQRLKTIWNIECFYCGHDQPGYIEAFNAQGLVAVKADNRKRLGLDKVYELIATRKLKFFRGSSPYTIDELDTYHYPEPDDLEPDDNVKDNLPVEQNDHAMDALRYRVIMTYFQADLTIPKAPSGPRKPHEESYEQRYKRLTSRPKIAR